MSSKRKDCFVLPSVTECRMYELQFGEACLQVTDGQKDDIERRDVYCPCRPLLMSKV